MWSIQAISLFFTRDVQIVFNPCFFRDSLIFSEMSRPRTFSEDYRTNIFVVRTPFGMITVHANDHLVS